MKSEILAEELEWIISRLERTAEGMGEEEYLFKPTPVSNNAQWQLNHISRIVNIAIPRIIKGVSEYKPEGWPENYAEMDLPQERLLQDIKKGAEKAVEMLRALPDEALEEEIPLWGGTQKRKVGLFAYIGEVFHHRGQLAYIRGTWKRLQEKAGKT